MKKVGLEKWRSTVAAVVVVWVALGLVLPLIIKLRGPEFPLHGYEVSAAPTDTFFVTSPVALSREPGLRLDRGTLSLAAPAAANAEPLDALYTKGTARLVLDRAALHLEAARSSASDAAQEAIAPLVDILANLKFENLTLRRATMTIAPADGHVETLYDMDAEITHNRRGVLNAKGAFTLRGLRLSFDLTTGRRADRNEPAHVPLKLAVSSSGGRAGLEMAIDGRLGAAAGLTFEGQSEVSIGSVRQAARWLGAPWPSGPGLRDVKIKGQIKWIGRTLAFDKASFEIDRNQAAGALTLDLASPRPTLSGTLAFKTLDLNPYLRPEAGEEGFSRLSWAALSGSEEPMPLARYADIDVRVSTARVQAGELVLGRSAATLTLNNGKLLADIAELEWHDGYGGGQIMLDAAGPKLRATVRGKIEDMDFARASLDLIGRSVLSGRGAVVGELSATGTTLPDFLKSLSGKLALTLLEGGRLGIDVKGLLDAARLRDLDGWGTGGRGQTPLDKLGLRVQIKDGVVASEQIQAESGDVRIVTTGTVNLPETRLDLRVTTTTSSTTSTKTEQLLLHGPWTAPMVRSESTPGQDPVPLEDGDQWLSRSQRTWRQRG